MSKSSNKIILIFSFALCFFSNSVFAQRISPYFGVGTDIFNFKISKLAGTNSELDYEPNIPALSRFGLSVDGFGLSYASRSSSADLNSDKGNSTFTDIQLGYHNTQWGIDTYYQQYKGFYLNNSSDFSLSSYQLFPNLTFQHYGFKARISLAESDFSIDKLMTQTDQITQSEGNYFFTFGYRHYIINYSDSFIPTTLQSQNQAMTELRKLSSQSLNVGLGAGKYWVNDWNLFIGGVFDINASLGRYLYTKDDASNSELYYETTSYGFKLGTGYSGKTWRTGLNFASDVTTLQGLNRTYIKPNATSVMLYLRYDSE